MSGANVPSGLSSELNTHREDRPLEPGTLRAIYDRIGRYQDTQRFYEDPAVDRLLIHAGMSSADAVFELGCGTGRLAHRLLRDELPAGVRYRGVDLSPTMVRLTRERIQPWADRADAILVDGSGPLPAADDSHDRLIATYVFDLLAPSDAAAALDELRRIAGRDGLLCVAGLAPGASVPARVVDRAWMAVWRRAPGVLGGCRPVSMAPLLADGGWRVEHRETITAWARTSEVILARSG